MSVTADEVNSILDAAQRGIPRAVVIQYHTSGSGKTPDTVRVVTQTISTQPPPVTTQPPVSTQPVTPPRAPDPTPDPIHQERLAFRDATAARRDQHQKMVNDHRKQRIEALAKITRRWTYDSVAKNIIITTSHRPLAQRGHAETVRGPITGSTLRTWLREGACPEQHDEAVIDFLHRYCHFWSGMNLQPAGDRYGQP
jgi:hypothetical protein